MSKRLTEEMVIARTKIGDLSKIKRLNCWGSELSDVSLLRKMPHVEVLSLSINKINSLVDFQFCKKLEELYIRQNEIRDLNEVMYLQVLPNLKNLWLGENPCANFDGYRLAVIRALPQLQKLDNVAVGAEETREASRRGRDLVHPDDAVDEPEEESEEEYVTVAPAQQPAPAGYGGGGRYNREAEPVRRSPPAQETDYDLEESEDLYPREDASEESREYSPPRQASPPRRQRGCYSPPEPPMTPRRNSYERESPRQAQYYESQKSPTNTSFEEGQSCESSTTANTTVVYRENKIVNSQSASCIKEYTNGDRYIQQQQTYRQEGSEVGSNYGHEKRERYSCPAAAHRPPFARRPVTRNSNILSAVLCLVKELDYPSLEVVEMAVRCRMDELDE